MLSESELARRANGQIVVRESGLRVQWRLNDLFSSDGHRVEARFACIVRALPNETDLKMLEESLLSSRPVLTATEVAAHFFDALLGAARRAAEQCDAEALLTPAGNEKLLTALMEAGRAMAFGCGLELSPPAQLNIDVPSLQRARMEALQRQTAERRAAEQVDHLRRSTELFKQFQSLRDSAPELKPGQILSRMASADQANLIRSMLEADAHGTHAASKLWAVAGDSLFEISAGDVLGARRVEFTPGLGPIRSVRGDGDGGLLLGCRSGILRLDPRSPAGAVAYRDPEINSQLGFNSAVIVDDFLWASHSEGGVVGWKLHEPDRPPLRVRPDASPIGSFSPRNLTVLNDRLLFSSRQQLLVIGNDGVIQPIGPSGPSDIVAIVPFADHTMTILEDGSVCAVEHGTAGCHQQRRAGCLSTATTIPWLGDVRLLLATEDGPILCVGADDELVTQYSSVHRGLRTLAASAQLIAAVTNDRQRLVLWHTWDGSKPFAEIHLYGIARHRIADIAFA